MNPTTSEAIIGGTVGDDVIVQILSGPLAGGGATFKSWTKALRWCDQQTGLVVVNRDAAEQLAASEERALIPDPALDDASDLEGATTKVR